MHAAVRPGGRGACGARAILSGLQPLTPSVPVAARRAGLSGRSPINRPPSTLERMTYKRVIAAAVLAAVAGCSRGREYELRGQVLSVDPDRQELTVKHEDIRGFMPGMTMPFRVRDRKDLDGRAPGELITATLVVGANDAHLSNIRHTGSAPLTDAPPPVRVDILQPGHLVPDEPFVDHRGAPVRLSAWRSKAVAVTFIYTRCPLPDFCPSMDRHFAAVQQAAARDDALRGRVQLVSVSFDPLFDTPGVLSAHAARVGADTTSWSFVTGDPADIERFAGRLGVSIIRDPDTPQEIVHNLRTAIVDGEGRLVKVFSGTDWNPADLLAELRRTVAGG